ncbi:MAG: class I SAM-dependent methyltransferase [Bacteroidales bacterium]|jgi:SAM-dependent methyltransferase|nr:class I SAM-dependent methyltransferase [Bacteroidales bacterium]
MKDAIKQYIEQILYSLQMEDCSYDIYQNHVDTFPMWIKTDKVICEFAVCIHNCSDSDRLSRFIGKTIYNGNNNTIYWFEGDVAENIVETFCDDVKDVSIDWLKQDTRLPVWLDSLIFKDLLAQYAPDFQRFDYNLNLTKEDNLKYLGTYFPRSYAESFCIFSNIFQNDIYNNLFNHDTVSVLSVGCGTGGDVIGLLTAIQKYCTSITTLTIYAIDGNKEALLIFKRIVNKLKDFCNIEIEFNTINETFQSTKDIDIIVDKLPYKTFDFILSFKMLCELIFDGKGSNDNAYYEFTTMLLPRLSNIGLCCLLDVTTKSAMGKFIPVLMNTQLNQALRDLEEYATLLPLPCSLYESICYEECFTQRHFFVSSKQKDRDISKVCYRIIGHKQFIASLKHDCTEIKYVLRNKDGENICCSKAKGNMYRDGYKL